MKENDKPIKLMDMTMMESNYDKLDYNIETNTTHSRLT